MSDNNLPTWDTLDDWEPSPRGSVQATSVDYRTRVICEAFRHEVNIIFPGDRYSAFGGFSTNFNSLRDLGVDFLDGRTIDFAACPDPVGDYGYSFQGTDEPSTAVHYLRGQLVMSNGAVYHFTSEVDDHSDAFQRIIGMTEPNPDIIKEWVLNRLYYQYRYRTSGRGKKANITFSQWMTSNEPL